MDDQITLELTLEGGTYRTREEIYSQVTELLREAGDRLNIEPITEKAPSGSQLDLVTVSLIVGIVAGTVGTIRGVVGIIKDVREMKASYEDQGSHSDTAPVKAQLSAKNVGASLEIPYTSEEEVERFASEVASTQSKDKGHE